MLVRPHPDIPGELEILAGHTRYEVALLEKLGNAPIKVFDAADEQALEIGKEWVSYSETKANGGTTVA